MTKYRATIDGRRIRLSEHTSLPVLVHLTRGYATIIDAEDAERVLAHKWVAAVDRNGRVYARMSAAKDGIRTFTKLHDFIAGEVDGRVVDHANRDSMDNRRANLRHATRSQNNANRRGWSRLGVKGVRVMKGRCGRQRGKPFGAHIKVNRRSTYLGSFTTPEEAARAYDAAARRLFGEFALTNFPDE